MFSILATGIKRLSHKTMSTPVASLTTTMAASTKLSSLRALMSKHNLAAYFIPSEDAHQVGATEFTNNFNVRLE